MVSDRAGRRLLGVTAVCLFQAQASYVAGSPVPLPLPDFFTSMLQLAAQRCQLCSELQYCPTIHYLRNSARRAISAAIIHQSTESQVHALTCETRCII